MNRCSSQVIVKAGFLKKHDCLAPGAVGK
jgi:hypothetical protein